MARALALVLLLLGSAGLGWGQSVFGRIRDEQGRPLKGQVVPLRNPGAQVAADSAGHYRISLLPGRQRLIVAALGYQSEERTVQVPESGSLRLDFGLQVLEASLDAVTVEAERLRGYGIRRLGTVEDFGLYEAKKSEVIVLKDLTVNQSTNNTRQIYARVPGLNVWESDQAGLQLGIGGRGLSPNRTSNFNTRQNGYDISADALGYPESYYTPPPEATEQIEIVRGAAALQYGTQFGGMLNFKLKGPSPDKKLDLSVRQTGGSWGFLNSLVQASGTVGKVGYAGFYQHKQSDGWRPNAGFSYDMARGYLSYRPTARLLVSVEYTFMAYLARQPGGLSDRLFAQDPRQSVRDRNWFRVDWNLFAAVAEYSIAEKTRANLRVFGLVAQRQALGNLQRVTVADFAGAPRDLIDGQYHNVGAEARLVHEGRFLGRSATLLAGVRLYRGFANNRQGIADSGSGPNFKFLTRQPSTSDYRFPSANAGGFAEAAWAITDRFSLVPGIRAEYIVTESFGRYTARPPTLGADLPPGQDRAEQLRQARPVLLAGLGAGYKPLHGRWEGYANICQNYRAINFNDIRIDNPSLVVDSNIRDEMGFSADLGLRSRGRGGLFQYDVSAFWVQYNNRIGSALRADRAPLFLDYRYRTNIGDAAIQGLEAYGETDLLRIFRRLRGADSSVSRYGLALFGSAGYQHARYTRIAPGLAGVKVGNEVEQVPQWVVRAGLTLTAGRLRLGLQYSRTTRQFSDATNAPGSSDAVIGIVPAYSVWDLTAAYFLSRHWRIEASCNNLLDARYYTRRADSYPGPGILPADARAFYGTLAFTL